MMKITRTTNVTRARLRLLALQERTGGVTLAVAEASQGRDKGVIVDWPKFVIEQGYKDRGQPEVGGNLGAKDPLPQTQTQTQTQTQPKKKRKSRASRSDLCLAPEFLPNEDFERLCEWAEKKHGLDREAVGRAWERIYLWSKARGRKNKSWYAAAQGYITDGWPLKGGSNSKPPKSWAQAQEDETFDWLRKVSDESADTRSVGSGAGASVPELPERSNGCDQDDIPF
jgi:hypothetical protein